VSRARIAVFATLVIAFAIVAGVLVYGNRSHGGQKVTIEVTVTKASSMTPSDLTAHRNDTVTINIKSDTTGEVHLHGYDIPFDCVAGQTVSHTFTADKTGDFEIEWEETSTHLGHLVVTP